MKDPTYTAQEIKELSQGELDVKSLQALSDLINEEISLYPADDLPILMHASMMIFTRSLLMGLIK